jgi:predicted oxidoreductase
MKRIKMGGVGPAAAAIGIGCMRIDGMAVKDVSALIHGSLEAGIDLFDHADIYGGGGSEALFGSVFAGEPSLREKIFIQSKCGIRDGCYDLSRGYIIKSTEDILKRLNTDYLDMLLLHRPDTLMEPEEIGEAFEALQTRGKVRCFGVSNMNPAQVALIQSGAAQKLLVNQLQFSPTNTGIVDAGINVNVPKAAGCECDDSVLEWHRLQGITIQAWSPLQYGWFEGTYLGSEKYPQLNQVLNRIASETGTSPAAAAIAWILKHPANMQVIPGTTRLDRVLEMAKACDIPMSREVWYEVYLAAGNRLP